MHHLFRDVEARRIRAWGAVVGLVGAVAVLVACTIGTEDTTVPVAALGGP